MAKTNSVIQIPTINVPELADVIGKKIEDVGNRHTKIVVTLSEICEQCACDEEAARSVAEGILGVVKGKYEVWTGSFSKSTDTFIIRV